MIYLKAILTPDWIDDIQSSNSCKNMADNAKKSTLSYKKALADIIEKKNISSITSLEQLFRRRTAGFDPLKKFVSVLASIETTSNEQESQAILDCHINVFAYAFLKAAKNFDFILPLADKQPAELLQAVSHWQTSLIAFEDFERTGKPLSLNLEFSNTDYLAAQSVYHQ